MINNALVLNQITRRGQLRELAPRAEAVLLAANGVSVENTARRLKLDQKQVEHLLLLWEENAAQLSLLAKQGGNRLQEQIEKILAVETESEAQSDFCCECDEDEDKSLTPRDIQSLAVKVYDLLRYELIIERERMGFRSSY